MKFTNDVVVTGMKRAKGDFEGTSYDSTKFFIEMELDSSKGNAMGKGAEVYSLGTSAEYDRYTNQVFPFHAVAEFEMVSTGKVSKVNLNSLKPKAERVAVKV